MACLPETAPKALGLVRAQQACSVGRGPPPWQRSPSRRPWRRGARSREPWWAPGRAGLGCPRSACPASEAPPRSGRGLQVRQGRGRQWPPQLRQRWARLSPRSPGSLVRTRRPRAARLLPMQMSCGGTLSLACLRGCLLRRSGSGPAQAPCPSSCTDHLREKLESPLVLHQGARAWAGGPRGTRSRLPRPRALSD